MPGEPPVSRAPKALGRFHLAALGAFYTLLLLRSFLEFDMSWDFLAYHLAQGLRAFGLTRYHNDPIMGEFLAGYPPLAHWAQGFLVWTTGRIGAASAVNAVAFLGSALLLR